MQIMFIIWSTWCSEILEQVTCDPKNIITTIIVLAYKHFIMSLMIRADYFLWLVCQDLRIIMFS